MLPANQSFGFQDEGIREIVLDSRKEMREALFVPIVGERRDGHDFIKMAISHGAAAVLCSRDTAELAARYPAVRFYPVPDTRRALQEIGLMERRKFRGTVLGVTGSVGKTSTRRMVALALSAGKRVFETEGNANSQVGVPITMFRMARSGAEAAVIELGMSEPGEMHRIAEVACVDIAIITNIGDAHIENLKSRDNILREKLHILDGMKDGGLLILNGDDPLLGSLDLAKIHAMGIAEGKEIRIRFFRAGDQEIRLQMPGAHMRSNAMAAMAAAEALSVDKARAAEALAEFRGLAGRGEIFQSPRGAVVIDDAYNASPASMRAALSVLSGTEGAGIPEGQPGKTRRIAVLSDMLELGEESPRLHRELGAYLAALPLPIDCVLLYGERARGIGEGIEEAFGKAAGESQSPREGLGEGGNGRCPEISCYADEDYAALEEAVLSMAGAGDVILCKGSHSMGLSRLVDALRESGQSQR